MLIALFDYMKYRSHIGRYSDRSIEKSHGKLATSANFPSDMFPKPGQIIMVHGRDSFLSWLIMYFTNSIWSHTAAGIDNGDIVEATLKGVVAHPFTDILNGTDYLVVKEIAGLTVDQEHTLVETGRSSVGTKYSYSGVAKLGLRLLVGRHGDYHPRLSIDLITTLLLTSWFGRHHRRLVVSCSALGIFYIVIVVLNTRYRKNLRDGHTLRREAHNKNV